MSGIIFEDGGIVFVIINIKIVMVRRMVIVREICLFVKGSKKKKIIYILIFFFFCILFFMYLVLVGVVCYFYVEVFFFVVGLLFL